VLAEKYRPKTFGEVIGQDRTIAGLRYHLDQPRDKSGLAFLLTGPSGSGKTTLAECMAEYWGIPEFGRHRIESAECDVQALRDLASDMYIYGPGNGGRKMYLIDEIHTVTGRAADRLLSLLESLPKHVLLVGTTTESDWAAVTLFSRLVRFNLQKPNSGLISAHLQRVAESEGLPMPEDPAAWFAKYVKYSPTGLNVRDLLNQLPAALFGGMAVAA
jgi:DNA polymerase-3 subunit gamma/tau